ncbi:MAG: bifunctional diaminohydroxyphosphoribosylaminopyrimidine deaminase/5-amino-6-(5-phosphoribosylamino)uracil reductase RibD, partial [Deltaproteobacteria bacterium]
MESDFERGVMQRAVEAAKRGRTSPNPRVGAAIVRDGEVISMGYHARAGQAHAEVDAIRNADGSVEGATLYVTLEPCNHQGRTGPCTEAILQAGIARVVIGCRDPAPHVAGAVDRLKGAGVEVDVGVLEEECSALVAAFAKHIRTALPFVTLKAAVTLDGKIATRTGDSKWITGEEARTETHRMRDESDAILVGVGTVLA